MKEITIKDLYNIFDPLTYIVLWTPDTWEDTDDAEPAYEGCFMDCPITYSDCIIEKIDDTWDAAVIVSRWKDKRKDGTEFMREGLIITTKERERR